MASDFYGATRWGLSAEAWRRGLASIGALIAAALLISVVILVRSSNHQRDQALERERESYGVLVMARGLDAAMAKSEAALGRFVTSSDQQTGALYYDQWVAAGHMLDRLDRLTRDDPAQAPLLAELRALYDMRGQELAEPATHATYRQGWAAISLFYKAGSKPSVNLIARVLDRIADNERTRLAGLSAASDRSVKRSNELSMLLSGLGGLLVLGAIVLGGLAVQAIAEQNRAREQAEEEFGRALTLEQAVAERTGELSQANAALMEEVATRAAAEAKLAQVQKMEAVGQLTGGIAHDFNNMLAVVVGGLDLARRRLGPNPGEIGRHLDNASEGASRAAALTRRLLSFARAEPLLPESVDPAKLIAGMSELIERTLGERFTVETRLELGGWRVWCDPNQLENAILNLAVNARDAMEGGGQLVIAAGHRRRDDEDHVVIEVVDQGCGMTPDVLDRVFEPFFTTKPVGKGTGLGLSQIFAFAKASAGEVSIASEPGQGTTVTLLLPRHHAPMLASVPTVAASIPAPAAAAGLTILVVEDDVRVRGATVAALEEMGHLPLPCAGGDEALVLLAARPEIALVVTDVVMPGMTGPELVERIGRSHPDAAILFVTGYVGEAGDAQRFRGHEVLRKPFTLAALSSAVAAALGRERAMEEAA